MHLCTLVFIDSYISLSIHIPLYHLCIISFMRFYHDLAIHVLSIFLSCMLLLIHVFLSCSISSFMYDNHIFISNLHILLFLVHIYILSYHVFQLTLTKRLVHLVPQFNFQTRCGHQMPLNSIWLDSRLNDISIESKNTQ